MSSIYEEKEVGIIVGEATSSEFFFASERKEYPPKWEYLIVDSQEVVEGELRDVHVLAQVERIVSVSDALSAETDIEALRKIRAAGFQDVRTWGRARVLGYISDMSPAILFPRRAIVPGRSVYIAAKEYLAGFYSYPKQESLHIGSLISRPDVPVYLYLSGFRRHLAIIAQTGAGKSYCSGVLIEELLEKGATVLVLDPHADYVFLSQTPAQKRYDLYDKVTVFRNPASTGRYAEEEIHDLRKYTMAFSDLGFDEICDVAGISRKWVNIRQALEEALEVLGERVQYGPRDLLEVLEDASRDEDDKKRATRAASASKYAEGLARLGVFGTTTTPVEEVLRPMHVSVLDLSGLTDISMDYVASRLLKGVYDAVSSGGFPFPVFVFVEEAHKFIPPELEMHSSSIIKRISAEGRKFGVFLVLISQRPSKVNPDSLSQCNSQIIMKLTNPKDQLAVSESSERMSQDLLDDLPGLNPGEAIVVGEITKAPVMVKVRPRKTREGGADIDVVAALRGAMKASRVSSSLGDTSIEEVREGEMSSEW